MMFDLFKEIQKETERYFSEDPMKFDFGEAMDEFSEYDSSSKVIQGDFEVVDDTKMLEHNRCEVSK